MKQFYRIFLMLLFAVSSVQAQEGRKVLKGKVIANSSELGGIYIVNLKTDADTVTEDGGYFSIPAKEGDTLMFSAVQFNARKTVIKKEDLESSVYFVKMEVLTRQLDEVMISQYKNINAESLRIIPKGQKKYTPAERKLAAAGELHWYSPLLIPVGGMSVDGLLNSISGRTAMLKKELLVERKEILMKKITNQFDENYFTETLHIPKEYVPGFQFYLVENKELESAINAKNKTMAAFIMNRLAIEYLDLLQKK